MAETGKYSAQQIENRAKRIVENSGTMGVSLYPCSVPGRGKMFDMPDNMMEVGLGIHGEPGCERETVMSAGKIVTKIMNRLQNIVKFTKATQTTRIFFPDQPIVLLINNLGGVSQLEMGIIKSEAVKWCLQHSITIARLLCGTYMTSLDGHGISLTVLKQFDEEILELLDAPTSAPGWHVPDKLGKPKAAPPEKGELSTLQYSGGGVLFTKGDSITSFLHSSRKVRMRRWRCSEQEDIGRKCVNAVCEKMIAMEAELNALDSAAGDGDCGTTFAQAARTIMERMETLPFTSAQQLLHNLSEIFEYVGGTGGA
ncbi:unnamed protein product, partial [Strongylus vulgaris]